jgi:hypothetical protein
MILEVLYVECEHRKSVFLSIVLYVFYHQPPIVVL